MNFLFDGEGYCSVFTRLEIIRKGNMNYYCFWVPFSHYDAKRLGYYDKQNFDKREYEEGTGRLILTFPEFIKGERNVHQLRSQPNMRTYFVETSWRGKETSFKMRKISLKEDIEALFKRRRKLKIIRAAREKDLQDTLKSKEKEIQMTKGFVRSGYQEHDEP